MAIRGDRPPRGPVGEGPPAEGPRGGGAARRGAPVGGRGARRGGWGGGPQNGFPHKYLKQTEKSEIRENPKNQDPTCDLQWFFIILRQSENDSMVDMHILV